MLTPCSRKSFGGFRLSRLERDAMAVSRVLIIKLGALGDVIIATSVIRQILAAHGDDEVWLLTSAPFIDLFSAWPALHVHTVRRHGFAHTTGTIAWIRRQRFARIYDLQSNDRTALLCALSGTPMRIGNHPRYPYTHHPTTPHRKAEHGFGRLQLMLAAAGLSPAEERPYLPATEDARAQVELWILERGLAARPFAVMHSGASPRWPAKRWPGYADLAARVEEHGVKVVWLGAGADAALNAQLAQRAGIDATDRFSIPALAELARHARFAVTNDSGPMHALASAGISVYAFFGPTDWRRSHALGQREHVLFNPAPCTACARTDRAAAADHTCLPGITVEQVMMRLHRGFL